MKKIDEQSLLLEKISALKLQQAVELEDLKHQMRITYNSIQPLNLIKSTLHELISSVDVQADLVTGAGNVLTGLVSKNPLLATFQKPINKIINTLLRAIINRFSPKK